MEKEETEIVSVHRFKGSWFNVPAPPAAGLTGMLLQTTGAADGSLSKIAKTRLIPLADRLATGILHSTAPTKTSASKARRTACVMRNFKTQGAVNELWRNFVLRLFERDPSVDPFNDQLNTGLVEKLWEKQ